MPAEDTAAFGAIAERFRRAGALERAVELCREGLQKFPDHLSARVTLGWSLLDLGKYDEARDGARAGAATRAGQSRRHSRPRRAARPLRAHHARADGRAGQWPPDPSALDGLHFDPAARSTPADVPLKSAEPLSLDGLLSGAKIKGKAKGKKAPADDLVDVVMPPVSSESARFPISSNRMHTGVTRPPSPA